MKRTDVFDAEGWRRMNATNNICSCISQQKEKNRKKGVTGKSVPINNSNELFPFPNIFPPCPFPLNVHQVNNPAEKSTLLFYDADAALATLHSNSSSKLFIGNFITNFFAGTPLDRGKQTSDSLQYFENFQKYIRVIRRTNMAVDKSLGVIPRDFSFT